MIVLNATLFHVDVFATAPLTGNGLTVFLDTDGWSHSVMQRLTREMKQFESIFLSDISPAGATARVFTAEEELPFAGHPVVGAAAVLHRAQAKEAEYRSWMLRLPHGTVAVTTRQVGDHYLCEMNQGAAMFGGDVAAVTLEPILARLGLGEADLVSGISARVVSTGLPYLIIPVRPDALARAVIQGRDLEDLLGAMGAKFVLVLDVERPEIRTWDNLGQLEDVATGSAAGPAAAYLFTLGLADRSLPVDLAQGRFAGRPSRIAVVESKEGHLLVSGEVWPVSHGVLDLNPSGARILDSGH
jgi:PhzF family phenazine biosynthesis protein